MNLDWLSNLLPLINAIGVPLLALAVIFLLRAYQSSVETYKDTTNHMKEENDRLRLRLAEADAFQFGEVEKVRAIVASSLEVTKELQARKVALLSSNESTATESVISDVSKINEVIGLLNSVSELSRSMELRVRDTFAQAEGHLNELSVALGKLVEQIGDTESRVTVVSFITNPIALQKLNTQIEGQPRGITVPPSDGPQLEPPKDPSVGSLPTPEFRDRDTSSAESRDASIPHAAKPKRMLDPDKFLNPNVVKTNLILSALYLAAYELLRSAIIDRINDFFTFDRVSGKAVPDKQYADEVIRLHKDLFYASCLWLEHNGVITSGEVEEIQHIRQHRNQVAHDLPDLLSSTSLNLNVGYFLRIRELLEKIEVWWVKNVEVPAASYFDGVDVNEDDIRAGSVIVLDYLISVALADYLKQE